MGTTRGADDAPDSAVACKDMSGCDKVVLAAVEGIVPVCTVSGGVGICVEPGFSDEGVLCSEDADAVAPAALVCIMSSGAPSGGK